MTEDETMSNGGRITTKEFYERQEVIEQRMISRFDMLMGRMDTLGDKLSEDIQCNGKLLEGLAHDIVDHEKRLDSHAGKIEKLQDGARNAGIIASTIAVIGSTIAALLGTNR